MNLPLAIQQLRLADLLYRQGLAGVLPCLVCVRVALKGLWSVAAMTDGYPGEAPRVKMPAADFHRAVLRLERALLEYHAAVELGREDACRGSLPRVAVAVEELIGAVEAMRTG